MTTEVQEISPTEVNPDDVAMQVFLQALNLVGGPRQLVEHRNLTWLPSLMESAYVVVLSEQFHKTIAEIAEFLGITEQTVRNILRADSEHILEIIEKARGEKEIKIHIAGGLAKRAYTLLKEKKALS